MSSATLYIFSGLPAVGKSTLAKKFSGKLSIPWIRIDTVEQGLKEVCGIDKVEGEGYRLSYRIVKDILAQGNNVIADSVNPFKFTRDEWQEVAESVGASFINIEIICSDIEEHKKRAESRRDGINNLKLPTWEEILKREFHEWDTSRILIDTANKSIDEALAELIAAIK